MQDRLPPLRLTGAMTLRDGVMQQRTVAVAEGRIAAGPFPAIDLTGYYVLPGIIDLHGDAFERHIAPRPTAPFPALTGLRGADRDAAAAVEQHIWQPRGQHLGLVHRAIEIGFPVDGTLSKLTE